MKLPPFQVGVAVIPKTVNVAPESPSTAWAKPGHRKPEADGDVFSDKFSIWDLMRRLHRHSLDSGVGSRV